MSRVIGKTSKQVSVRTYDNTALVFVTNAAAAKGGLRCYTRFDRYFTEAASSPPQFWSGEL
jgi:hypothetical protein